MASYPWTDATHSAVSPSPQLSHKQQQEHTNACPGAEEEQVHLWATCNEVGLGLMGSCAPSGLEEINPGAHGVSHPLFGSP